MNKTEFFDVIQKETGHLTSESRRKIMSHFTSQLALCESDSDIDKRLGTPEAALRKYLNTSKVTSKIPRWLFAAALIIISPLIAYAALIASALFLLAACIFVLIPASGIILWLEGMRVIFTSIPQSVILSDKLWQIGLGLMAFAAGSLIITTSYVIYSKFVPWLIRKLPELKDRVKKRRLR